MQLSRETRDAYVAMAASFLMGGVIRGLGYSSYLDVNASPATFACYSCSILVWLRLMRSRELHPTAIACLRAVGLLMVGWLFVRTVKYEFMSGFYELVTLAWYSYYLFYALIAATLFVTILHAGTRVGERIDRRWWAVVAVAAAIGVLFLTNDLHELAFRFDHATADPGILKEFWSYTYGPLYYLSWAWVAGLAIASAVVSAARLLRSVRIRDMAVLLVPLLLGIAYALNAVRAPQLFPYAVFRIPEATCCLIIVFVECMVRLGLYPSNEGYAELWQASSMGGGFMSLDGSVVFASAGMPAVTAAQVEAALDQPVPLDRDTVLVARPVRGGSVFWLRDLAHVHALQAELAETAELLDEENAMLEAETSLTHEREVLARRAQLHRQIMDAIAPQVEVVERLLADEVAGDEAFLARMHQAAVHMACAKRMANLMLVGEGGTVDARELHLACVEVGTWLRACGVDAALPVMPEGILPTDEALELFRAYVGVAFAGDDPLAGGGAT